jgi:hypothetical protein
MVDFPFLCEGYHLSMVVVMRIRLFLVVICILILSLPAWAQDSTPADSTPADSTPVDSSSSDSTSDDAVIDSSSGPVEREPDVTEDTINIPLTEDGQVNWADYLALPPGIGATWGFISTLYPPDPSALYDSPSILLDSAWSPPIPFAYGFEPAGSMNITTTGWWYIEDSTGNLARRDMTISSDQGTWDASTWFMAGTNTLHIEQGWTTSYYSEDYYLPDEYSGPGIEYFLKSVWFRGVIGGDRMLQLLQICNAQRIGRDTMNAGQDRQMIFQIPSNEFDRQNGRGKLLVWVSNGHNQLIRTRLFTAYATEVTDFKNIQQEVELDPNTFYSDYLPEEVYWSMDQYLLTHETPFFATQEQTSFTAAPETTDDTGAAGTDDTSTSDTSTGEEGTDGESTEDSGTDSSG